MRSGRARRSDSGRAREAVDRAAVEGHALVEGVFEFGGGDVEGLVATEHVGEPQLDEAHAALLDGAKDVLRLRLAYSTILAPSLAGPTCPAIKRTRGSRAASGLDSPAWGAARASATLLTPVRFAAILAGVRRVMSWRRPSRTSSRLRGRAADRLGHEGRDDVGVDVGVRSTVLEVAAPSRATARGDAHRRAAVGDAVGELRCTGRSRARR